MRLTPRGWRETASKVNPQEVKGIRMVKVNVGECCQELFDFISECINCKQLIILNVIDNTDKNSDSSHHHPVAIKKLIRLLTPNVKGNTDNNSDLSHHLSVSIKNLTRLIRIDIRDTNLSRGWREVLSSITSPHIRVLTLWGDNLGSG